MAESNSDSCSIERELRRRIDELTAFMDSAAIGLCEIDAKGRIRAANQPQLQLLGYARDEYIGHQASDFHADEAVAADLSGRLNRGEKLHNYEAKLKCKDGSVKTVLIDSIVHEDEGHFIQAQCFMRDITAQKQKEEADAYLAAIVQSSNDAIIGKDLNGIIRSWNAGAQRMFGYSSGEAVGQSVEILIPPDRLDEESAILKRLRQGEHIQHFDTVRVHKSGMRLDVSLTISVVRDRRGNVIGASKIARDITHRKRIESALRESEARFRELADAMPQIVWTARPNGFIDYYNRRWYEFIGVAEGHGDQSWIPILHPDDVNTSVEAWDHALRSGNIYEVECRFRDHKTGGYHWHLARALPARDALGQIVKWYGTCTDIDEQKRAEERFVRLNETLVAVMEAIPDVVLVTTKDGHIEFKNPAASRFILATEPNRRLPAPIQAELERVIHTGEHHLPTTFKTVHRFVVDGVERYFLSRIVGMTTPGKRLFGAVVMLQDVTEFRLLDEVKTNLISTVSHELKTPITSVRTALLVLLEQAIGHLNERQVEMVTIARDEAERLLRTLNALLDLTRFEDNTDGMRLVAVTPEELIGIAVKSMRVAAAHARVILHMALEPGLPPLKVDRERILNVLTNFLTNAIKYSPEGGRITVSARKHEQGVYFSVTDEGPGVPEQYQSRIFDKFFRAPGTRRKGVGLGLSIARDFVRAHRGRVGLLSTSGQGSEFFFVLPTEDVSRDARFEHSRPRSE